MNSIMHQFCKEQRPLALVGDAWQQSFIPYMTHIHNIPSTIPVHFCSRDFYGEKKLQSCERIEFL